VLREEVRGFVSREIPESRRTIDPLFFADPEISRKIGRRGWIGMSWPKEYGGGGRSAIDRYVVLEELLAAGVPLGAHLTADRQSGPLLLRYGNERLRAALLPRIAGGDCYFCIGLSESGAGSDLAAVRTRGVRADGGWRVSGTKLWTSNAQLCHYMITLVRTGEPEGSRHHGLSQFLIDLSAPGITVRPITNMAGSAHFNEVIFDDCFVADEMVIGEVGSAWSQIIAELALERSGPERFLSSFQLLVALVEKLGSQMTEAQAACIGRLVAHGYTVRRMSVAVNAALDNGSLPHIEAAFVKDLGTNWEQEIADSAQAILDVEPDPMSKDKCARLLGLALLHAPSFSLRGGTREIIRSIIARGLGLR
jgi:alkylation response protein AidB-like acyl-CoA dehydrogenase